MKKPGFPGFFVSVAGTFGLQLLLDKGFHCVAQFDEAAVKKVLAVREHGQLRAGIETIHEVDGFIDVNQFILVSLHQQPGAVWHFLQVMRKPGRGRGDAYQA